MIDKSYGFIWSCKVTDVGCHDGAQLEDLGRYRLQIKQKRSLAVSPWACQPHPLQRTKGAKTKGMAHADPYQARQ